MRNIPVYSYGDNAYSFVNNGTEPTPLHLLKPETAFRLAEQLPAAIRALTGLDFSDINGDGQFVALYADAFDYICGRIIVHGIASYYTAKEFFELTSATDEDRKAGSPHLDQEGTPQQQMAKFNALIPKVQALIPCLNDAFVKVIRPETTGGLGEVTVVASPDATFNFDYRNILIDAIHACDSFTAERGDDPNTINLCFFVDDCLDVDSGIEYGF